MEPPMKLQLVSSTGDDLGLVSEVRVPWSPSLEESELNCRQPAVSRELKS